MSVTSRVFHEINKVWQAQGDDEIAYLTEVKICPTLYDAMVLEGEDEEGKGYILFDPNKFNSFDGNYFDIFIFKDDQMDGVIEYRYE